MTGDTGDATAAQLSMYGTLLSVAAYTAAVDGDRSAAHDLIGEAAAAATRLGGDANHRFTAFGPTNVALYRLSIAQVLGDNGAAVEHARTVRTAAITTPERRGRYWIDLARAYHQWGKHPQCYQALIAAERAAPADVRYRPPVHRMVTDLCASTGAANCRNYRPPPDASACSQPDQVSGASTPPTVSLPPADSPPH